MDLLGDLGMQDQLTSVRAENAVLQEKVKELSARVKTLTIENESLKAEVETYRQEMALPSFSKLALGGGSNDDEAKMHVETTTTDDFVRAGNSVYPKKNHVTLPELHGPSNNLCCALSPDDVVLASGGADATLRLMPWGAASGQGENRVAEVVQQAVSISCAAPVISVAFSPVMAGVVAVGCMDGSTALVHYKAKAGTAALQTTVALLPKKHVKYVRNVAWSSNEPLFASSSADGNIFLYKVEKKTEFKMSDNDEDDDTVVKLEATLTESLHLTGAVEAMCFAAGKLICYVRDTPYLTYFDLEQDMKQTKINLNSNNLQGTAVSAGGFSDHVSFAILDLRPFQDKYLAAATDTSRNLVLDLHTGRILRNLYGHSNDGFSQPRLAWSASGQYVVGNTQDGSVLCVWDVASQQIVERPEGHSSPIRDIAAGNTTDMLVTTAFDRSTRLWFTE